MNKTGRRERYAYVESTQLVLGNTRHYVRDIETFTQTRCMPVRIYVQRLPLSPFTPSIALALLVKSKEWSP